MSMDIVFPGGVAVEAVYRGHRILTDQPVKAGGAGAAPAPFDLFLASIGTCAGYYALRFCQERGLPTQGLRLGLDFERDAETHRVAGVRLTLRLPEEFPPKYREAIGRAMNQCSVKRHLAEPPAFVTVVEAGEEALVSS